MTMTTTREPTIVIRHRETINSIARTMAQREACLANLVRYEVRLKALRKLEARQLKKLAKPAPAPKPAPVADEQWQKTLASVQPLPPAVLAECRATADDEPIPAFLQRKKQIEDRDATARAEIEQARVEGKRAKSKVAAEKRKVREEKTMAKLTGATKRMPLTGRAALEHIRRG